MMQKKTLARSSVSTYHQISPAAIGRAFVPFIFIYYYYIANAILR